MQSALDWFTGAPLNISIIITLAISISLLGQRSISRFMNQIATADLIQTSNVAGHAQKGANSTKVVGTALEPCSGGFTEVLVHLE